MGANAECGKSYEILFACDADKRFDMKVKCSTGRGPPCAEKNSSQKPGICPGGWAVLELTGTSGNYAGWIQTGLVSLDLTT